MAINVGSVAVSVVPSAEGFSEKLRAQLGNLPSIDLVLDTTEASAKIDAIRAQLDAVRDGHASIDLDSAAATAEIAALRAQLDALGDKRVNVDVDDNGTAGSLGSSIANAVSGASVVSAAKVALIGEALLALIPLAGAVAASVAAIGGGIFAIGAGAIVGKLALGGVGDALSAANKPSGGGGGGGSAARSGNQLQSAQLAQQSQEISARQAAQSAADGVTAALEHQRAAENTLASAQQAALQAQRDLNTARLEAQQSLEDLSNRVIDNGLAQRQAAIALAQAKQSLDIANANPDAANPVNAQALSQIQLTYEQAKQQASELAVQGQRLAAEKAQADGQGVTGAASVVQAQQKVKDSSVQLVTAHQGVTDAARKLAEARQNVTDTAARNAIAEQQAALSLQNAGIAAAGAAGGLSAYQQAMAKLDPTQQSFVRFLQSIKPQLDGLKAAAADSFLPLLQGAIQTVLPLLPTLERILSSVGTALGTIATRAATALTGPFWTQFFQFLNTDLAPLLVQVGGLFGSLFQAGAAGFQTFLPVISQVIQAASGLGSAFAATATGGGLAGLVGYLASALPQVGATLRTVFGAVSAVLQGLAPAAGPALQIIQLLAGELKTLAPILSPLVTAFSRLLLQALTPLAPILTRLVQQLVPPLIQTLSTLAPLVPIIGQAFADLIAAVAPLLPVLAQLVAAILPPLVGFIEVLVNQGIGPLVAALVSGLTPVLPVIAKAFTDIFTALQPLIPPLTQILVKAIQTLVPQLPQVVTALTRMAVALAGLLVTLTPVIVPLTTLFLRIITQQNVNSTLAIASAVTGLLNALNAVAKGIGSAVSTIKIHWDDLFDSLSDKASSVVGAISTAVKSIVNVVIDAINVMIRGLNNLHIHVPKIDTHVPGAPTFGGADIGFNVAQIPRAANGAIINPTANGSLLRAGEAGDSEAVIPLNRQKLKALGLGLGDQTFHVYEATSPSATAQAIARRQKFQAV